MSKKDKPECSLAQFVSTRREDMGLSQSGLSKRSALSLEMIENIESGLELFLSATIRQKLAKGLKLNPSDIKLYEKKQDFNFAPSYRTEEIKEAILNGEELISCPVCNEILITRIARMYDLEDNLMLHPKARCPKCPFQIK